LRISRRAGLFADSGEIARAAGIAGAIRGYLPSRWPQWFDPQPLPWQNVSCGPFARSAWITQAGDVVAVPTPGHTPDHVSIFINHGDQQVMLAGDASYLEEAMLSGTIDGVSPDESVRKRRSPTSARGAPHARRSICRRTIRDPPKGSPRAAR
jgi:N-acyl homoserine lactone hydrolase